MNCVLCHSIRVQSLEDCAGYFVCSVCDLRFLDPAQRLSSEAEKQHYLLHNNDVHDVRYRNFVEPLYIEIITRTTEASRGLDYGAGPGPVVATMLNEKNIRVDLYDPYFPSTVKVLNERYDFIYASESAEHFYDPAMEFLSIKKHLKPNGFLAIMTHMYDPEIQFNDWYYRRDPTHVCFYSIQTMLWIQKWLGFQRLEIVAPRVAVFF